MRVTGHGFGRGLLADVHLRGQDAAVSLGLNRLELFASLEPMFNWAANLPFALIDRPAF